MGQKNGSLVTQLPLLASKIMLELKSRRLDICRLYQVEQEVSNLCKITSVSIIASKKEV